MTDTRYPAMSLGDLTDFINNSILKNRSPKTKDLITYIVYFGMTQRAAAKEAEVSATYAAKTMATFKVAYDKYFLENPPEGFMRLEEVVIRIEDAKEIEKLQSRARIDRAKISAQRPSSVKSAELV